MSAVTNLILSISIYDDDYGKPKEVNAFFLDRETKPVISADNPKLPKAWYEGSKFLERAVSIGAFKQSARDSCREEKPVNDFHNYASPYHIRTDYEPLP